MFNYFINCSQDAKFNVAIGFSKYTNDGKAKQ